MSAGGERVASRGATSVRRGGALLAVGVSALACIIKLDPPKVPPSAPPPIEVPVPFPVPVLPPSPDNRPRVQILWQFAMTPATAVFASRYEEWIGRVVKALQERDVVPQVVIAPLYAADPAVARPRGAWDFGLPLADFSRVPSPRDVLATMAGDIDPRDTVPPEQSVLADLGRRLGTTRIEGIVDGAGFVTFASPFTKLPRLLLVITVSPWPRRCAESAAECALLGARPVDYFAAQSEGGLNWAIFGAGARLLPEQVVHAAIATREDLEGPALVAACTAEPNFPGAHLDLLESARGPYYSRAPFSFFDYCAVMSDPTLLYDWAAEVRIP